MSDYVESKLYDLECLSPVHIGSGEVLKSYMYLYDRRAQMVYFLNEHRWVTFLAVHGLMEKLANFVSLVARGRERKNLWEWLLEQGASPEELSGLANSRALASTQTLYSDKGTLNDIARNIKLVDGRPYIPGSSLKGVLRTGILGAIIKIHPAEYGEFAKALADGLKEWNPKKAWGKTADALEERAFLKLDCKRGSKTDAVNSVLRGLQVSDGICTGSVADTIVLQKTDASTYANKMGQRERNLPLFRECIAPGQRFRFRLTLDRRFLKPLGIDSLQDVLTMSRAFMQDGLQRQQIVFGKYYPEQFAMAEQADFFLGGGTGFLTKSLYYQLVPSEARALPMLKKYFDVVFSKNHVPLHQHEKLDGKLSPRTLKLVRNGRDTFLMGLCRIQEVPSC